MIKPLNVVCGLLLFWAIFDVGCAESPNIVVVFADDLGYNDVSYHGTDSAVKTPHIDALAAEGVKLENHYVQPTCSPSRTAFLTGRYPYKIGVLEPFSTKEKSCLPFKTLLTDKLQSYGYKTHLVGKWHLGFCKEDCLPTSRGFDTFYGLLNGAADFYTHKIANGYDWHMYNSSGGYVLWDEKDMYAPTLLDNRVKTIIDEHDTADPLFIFMALPSVHTPIQPTDENLALFSDIEDEDRRKYLAFVKGLDDSVESMVSALKSKGIYDNTIVIFTSDNGGNPSHGASNWELSGNKGTLYEGGIKSPAFITGNGITNKGTTSSGLIHVSDWFPTLVSAIGQEAVSGLDGVSQWDMLSNGGSSPRSEIVHDIDTTATKERAIGAIRKDNMKLISTTGGSHKWVAPPESDEVSTTIEDEDGVQLYDITDDPFEKTNLASTRGYRSKRKELLDLLKSYRDAEDVESSVHVTSSDVDNMDEDGAYKTGWC